MPGYLNAASARSERGHQQAQQEEVRHGPPPTVSRLFPTAWTLLSENAPATAAAYAAPPWTAAKLSRRTVPASAWKNWMPSRNRPPPRPSVRPTALLLAKVAEVWTLDVAPLMKIPPPKLAELFTTCVREQNEGG